MPTSLPVKWMNSSMQGAPSMANASFGSMITVLDAVLVNGFNTKTIASITRTGTTATATISAGHLYLVDSVVNTTGADQDEYNGDKRVTSVTATTFTFEVTGTPVTPATTATALSVKTAPIGFDKPFSGVNKAAYRSPDVTGLRPYLRVDNSQHASWVTGRQIAGKVHMGLGMSDVDTFSTDYSPYDPVTGTGFSDWGWLKWHQSLTSGGGQTALNNASGSTWSIVGDNRLFFFLVSTAGSYTAPRMYAFGEFTSYKPSDPYAVMLWANDNNNEASAPSDPTQNGPTCAVFGPVIPGATALGQRLLKGYLGIGLDTQMYKISLCTSVTALTAVQSGYLTGIFWPNGPDQSLVIHPSYVQESAGHLRGSIPGLYCIHNNVSGAILNNTVLDSVTGYTGKKFLFSSVCDRSNGNSALGAVAFDITGPWR